MSANDDWQPLMAAQIVERSGFGASELVAKLRPLVDDAALAIFEEALAAGSPGSCASAEPLDSLLPAAERAAHGVYFTPPELAARIASHLDPQTTGPIVDLACGDGALMVAAARRCPTAPLVGVERDPLLAVAAAASLLAARGEARDGDGIHWGDGLAERPELSRAAAVIGNPPYVGEKGNKELFRRVRAENPHLEQWFGPRIDLHYLFLHRAVKCLRPGGLLVQLTSEYWLTATGARHLRRHLEEATEVTALERLGLGAFAAAPGHHSLLLVAERRRQTSLFSTASGGAWHPFAETEPIDGIPFGDVCRDRQGFVSGMDRVTARHAAKLGGRAGEPVFLWRGDEVPETARHLFKPVLRRADCVANRIFLEPPGDEHVLWVDDALDEADRPRVEAILEPYRPILEARREVQNGIMPWTRIWWPRKTAEYAQPKLVVPRRATSPEFCLDLSGAHISSDCTFILCNPEFDPIPSLLAVMLVANSPHSFEHLRQYGKRKGDVVEFYSEPLRRLPLKVEIIDATVVPRDPELRHQWELAVAQIG